MKTRDWILVVAALVLTIVIDLYTKQYFSKQPEAWYGPLHFIFVKNEGAMLGLFSDLSPFLRIVTLSTSGFFILSLYIFFQFILTHPVLKLRIGLSLLVGGIIGNVIDRTYYGYVIDFISFKIGNFHSPIWNLADMIQWVGYVLILYSFFKEGHLIWPTQDARNQFWVNKKFQAKYAAIFITTGVLISLICMVFSYTFLKSSLDELGLDYHHQTYKYTRTFIIAFGILVLTFSIFLFAVSKIISHRIAGPIYAFERFLNSALKGEGLDAETQALKLRAGDDFKNLELIAEKIKVRLKDLDKKENESHFK